jgi:hypothetical protein
MDTMRPRQGPDRCDYACATCKRKICTGARALKAEEVARLSAAPYAFAAGQMAAAEGLDEGDCPYEAGTEDGLRAGWLRGMLEYRRADGGGR